jgi:hypothetical protein
VRFYSLIIFLSSLKTMLFFSQADASSPHAPSQLARLRQTIAMSAAPKAITAAMGAATSKA